VYRFKGFDSAQCGDNLSALEAVINAWMESEHPRIRHVCQSVRGEHILLSFVYEDTHQLEQRVSAQAQATNPLPRFFDDEFIEETSTNPRMPIAPPPMH
jgi:hypothetical protein